MKHFFFVLAFSVCAFAQTKPDPFVTDYCTSYPEGTRERPGLWKHCCEEHDLFFWAGGSLEDRNATDLRLKSCVEATGEVLQARLMYLAVAIGGRSPIRFKTKQWGNAYPQRQRYLALTEEETLELLHGLSTQVPPVSPTLMQELSTQLNSRLDHAHALPLSRSH